MTKQECGTCRFFLGGVNRCRRYPPTLVGIPIEINGERLVDWQQASPSVGFSGWCGEWQISDTEAELARLADDSPF